MQTSSPVPVVQSPPNRLKLTVGGGWGGVGPLVAVIAFLPTLFTGFTGEDFIFVRFVATGKAFWQPSQNLFYRPLPNLLWQLDWSLWGLNAGGYHLTNLILHAANAWLVGRLALRLGLSQPTSGLAAGLFALHPLHVEPVAWLAGRPDLLATFFALTSLLFTQRYLTGQSPRFVPYLVGWGAYGAGLFCKESVVALPLVGLIWATLVIRPRTVGGWLKLTLAFGPHLVLLASYAGLRWQILGSLGGYGSTGPAFLRIGWNATVGAWWSLLWPVNFESLGWPVGLAVVVGLTLVYGWLIWQGRWRQAKVDLRLVGAGLALFYLTLGPALNNAPLGANLAQSRILYLPSVGFCLVIAGLIEGVSFRNARSGKIALVGLGGLGLFALGLALLPWWQAETMVADTFKLLSANRLAFQPGDTLYYEGLPDNWHGAYVWRNGLDDATALLINDAIDGQFRTPDLLIDYRAAERGQVWFLRYQVEPDSRLGYVFGYGVESPAAPPPARQTHSEDFTACQGRNFEWQMETNRGSIGCLPGQGRQLSTDNQKGDLTLTSPPLRPSGPVFWLDMTVYLNYEFQQAQVLSEVRVLDAQGRLLYTQPFDMAADGKSHRYHLQLPSPAQPGPYRVTIRLNKFRNDVLWQAIGWSGIN